MKLPVLHRIWRWSMRSTRWWPQGVLAPERRDGAEWPCWSAVHGFAELVLHGPLRYAGRRDVEALARRTVDDIVAGVTG